MRATVEYLLSSLTLRYVLNLVIIITVFFLAESGKTLECLRNMSKITQLRSGRTGSFQSFLYHKVEIIILAKKASIPTH